MGVEIYYRIKYDPKFCPLKKESVKISKSEKRRYVLAKTESEESYFIDSSAALIWNLMDGHHSIHSIKRRLQSKHSPEDVEGFINFAAKENLIVDSDNQAIESNSFKNPRKIPLKPEVVSPLIINMPILGASQSSTIFRKLYKLTRIFFTRIFLLIAIIVVGLTAFLLRDVFLHTLSSPESFTILGFLVFSIVLIFPILVVHELAHGLALTHFGANPGELGTGLYYFYPMFYCDTSESWRLSRGKRILVSIVGPLSTLFIGSIAGLLAFFDVVPSITYLLAMTFFFSYYIALLNMAPMFETDGYYALMDTLNIPNLRSEAFGYIKTLLTRGRRAAYLKYEEYSSRQRFAMVMFGVVSVLWSALAIYLSYLFFIYIIEDALTQLTILIQSVVTITGMSTNIEGVLISIGVAVGSLGLLTFISLRLYAMTYLPLKSVAERLQKSGDKAISVDGMYLSAFFLVPTVFSSIRMKLLKRMRKIAKRISGDYSVTDEGELVTVKLTLNRGVEKTFTQLRSEAIRYENTLRNNYNLYVGNLIKAMRKDSATSELNMIDRDNSDKAATLMRRKDFLKAFNERVNKVYLNVGQLLGSFVCFIWSVDLRPEVFSKLNPRDFEYSFLEDISTSTSIYDVGTFRKEKIIGSDNIEYMLKGMSEYFNTVREDPKVMQTTHATVLFEPVKNRLMIFGRAKPVSELRRVVEQIFFIPARSTFETTVQQDLSRSLLQLSHFMEKTPTFSPENIRNTEYKELKFIDRILDRFNRSLVLVDENIKAVNRLADTAYLRTRDAEREIRTLHYDVALLDLVIGATKDESGNLDSSEKLYSALARQNRRLLERIRKLKSVVATAMNKTERTYSKGLRKIGLLTIVALIASLSLAYYLNSILRELGAWNLILLAPIITISSVGLLSLLRATRISSKTHSPIIDSLLLLTNHYFSLASKLPPINNLFTSNGAEQRTYPQISEKKMDLGQARLDIRHPAVT